MRDEWFIKVEGNFRNFSVTKHLAKSYEIFRILASRSRYRF